MATQRKSLPSAMTRATHPRQFDVTISTGSRDRDNDTIDPRGWQLDNYRQNPVVFFNHDTSKAPIARALDVRVQGDKLVARMEFPPSGISPLADEIHSLMEAGFLHSTSVGFIPEDWTPNEYGGKHFTKQELTEFSVVNVPSQVQARVMRCAAKPCNLGAMKAWMRKNATQIGRDVQAAVNASLRQKDAAHTPWIRQGHEFIPLPDASIARDEDAAVLFVEDAPVSPVARRAGREAIRMVRQELQRQFDAPTIEIEDEFEIDERALAVGIASTCAGLLTATVATEVRRHINYHRGRVE